MEELSLRADGAGAGEFRGGSGIIQAHRILSDGNYFTGTYGRHDFLPWGVDGGKHGSDNGFDIIKADGTVGGPFGKYPRYPVNKGDVLRMITGTGGGYGNPFDRKPEKVALDVKNEFVTVEQARVDYGVLIDPETFQVTGFTEARKKHEAQKN